MLIVWGGCSYGEMETESESEALSELKRRTEWGKKHRKVFVPFIWYGKTVIRHVESDSEEFRVFLHIQTQKSCEELEGLWILSSFTRFYVSNIYDYDNFIKNFYGLFLHSLNFHIISSSFFLFVQNSPADGRELVHGRERGTEKKLVHYIHGTFFDTFNTSFERVFIVIT